MKHLHLLVTHKKERKSQNDGYEWQTGRNKGIDEVVEAVMPLHVLHECVAMHHTSGLRRV